VVKEGVAVKKGDTLLVLDSAVVTQKLEDATLDLQKAKSDLSSSRELLDIQVSQNAADVDAAEVAQQVADLDYKQYAEGTYEQSLANARTDLETARTTLQNRQDDYDQMKKLYAKDFVTEADMKKAELDLTTAKNGLAKAETALDVLTKYAHPMDLTSKESAAKQAKLRVERTKRQNAANLAWRTSDAASKEQALAVIKRRYDRLTEQLAATKIVAPEDGIVIYGTTGDRNSQNPIQEGTTVRERQLLIRLPDTKAMKVVVRIHESVVPKLKMGQEGIVHIVGVPGTVPGVLAKISPVADSSNRFWNPDLREYPVDVELKSTPRDLKPGMGATVEIQVDQRTNVLAAPLDAIYTVGEQRYAFVYNDGQVKPVVVTAGINNDTHAEITHGLMEGQQVIRLQVGQGRELLEKAGIQVAAATQPVKGKNGAGRREKSSRAAASAADGHTN
jgi:HlyD family secretion protein